MRRQENNAPTAHFSCREWIEDRKVRKYRVTSGLKYEDHKRAEVVCVPSGKKIYVQPHGKVEYKEQLEVAVGYSLSETVVSQIGTNTSISLEGGAGPGQGCTSDLTASVKGAIGFALTSLNSRIPRKRAFSSMLLKKQIFRQPSQTIQMKKKYTRL